MSELREYPTTDREFFNIKFADEYVWEEDDTIRIVKNNVHIPVKAVFFQCAVHGALVPEILEQLKVFTPIAIDSESL